MFISELHYILNSFNQFLSCTEIDQLIEVAFKEILSFHLYNVVVNNNSDSRDYQVKILLLLLLSLLVALGILGYLGWSLSAFLALGAFLVPAIATGVLLILGFVLLMQRVVWPLLSGLISYAIKKRVESGIRAALTESDHQALRTWLTVAAGQQEFTRRCWGYHFSSGESVWRYALQESDRLLAASRQANPPRPQQLSSLFRSQTYMRQIVVCWQEKQGLIEARSIAMGWSQKLMVWFIQRLGIRWEFTEAPMDIQGIREAERKENAERRQVLEEEKIQIIARIRDKMNAARVAEAHQQATLVFRLFNSIKERMSAWWWLLLGGILSVIAFLGYLGWSITAFLSLGASLIPIIAGGTLLFLGFILLIQRVLWPLLRRLNHYYSEEAQVQQKWDGMPEGEMGWIVEAWKRGWLSLKDVLSIYKILAELEDKEPVIAYEEEKDEKEFKIEQHTVREEYSVGDLLARQFSLPQRLDFTAAIGFESRLQAADSVHLALQQRIEQAQYQQEQLQQEEHEKKQQEQKQTVEQTEAVVLALSAEVDRCQDESKTFRFYEKCEPDCDKRKFLCKIHKGLLIKYPGTEEPLITENAWNILENASKNSGRFALLLARTDDLENLPKGFFLEKDAAGNRYILKYSAKLYEEQSKDPKQKLRADLTNKLFKSVGVGDAVRDEKKLLASLASVFSIEQNDFLSNLKVRKRQGWNRLYSGAIEAIFYTLEQHFNQEESSYFVDALIKCDKKEIHIIQTEVTSLTKTLLDALAPFLNGTPTFTGTKNIRNLSRLASLDDAILSWLYEFPMHHDSSHKNLNVVLECFLAFVDFFAEKGLALPKITQEQNHTHFLIYLMHLKNLIAYVQLSNYPGLQTRLLMAAPENSVLAKSQLLKGYSVVHAAMCLEYFSEFDRFFRFREPFMLLPADLKRITSADLLTESGQLKKDAFLAFRALFLRYIAFNGTGSDFEAALKKWQELIGEDLENYCLYAEIRAIRADPKYLGLFSDKLIKHWEALRDYALQFDKNKRHFAEEKEKKQFQAKFEEDINSPEQLAERAKQAKKYDEEDLDSLLTKLQLSDEEAKAIRCEIAQLNAQLDQIDPMKLALADSVKQIRAAGKVHAPNKELLHYLAELREAHYQHTTVIDHGKVVKKGEWMRLEQIVAVLLALRGKRLFQIDTSDGKTLIIRMAALLKAAQGGQVDVWTHNESLAERDCDEAQWLAYLSGLRVCKKSQDRQAVAAADIFYVDVSAAVLNDEISRFYQEEKKSKVVETRQAEEVLIDELDHIVIDVHASTTMQLAEGVIMSDHQRFDNFLMRLNQAVRRFPGQRDKICTELKDDPYYSDNKMYQDKVSLDRWIVAAQRASGLKRDRDYVIVKESKSGHKCIRIVHAKTSGRVDNVSEWGAGVHQCVTAWEKSQMPEEERGDLVIPPLSRTLTVADIANRLKRYKTYCGFTGTLGEKAVRVEMQIILRENAGVHIFPRAKRAIPKGEQWQWPKTDGEIVYRRGYAYPPEFLKTRKSQLQKIFSAIQYARRNNLSIIIFWSTIEECRSFYKFLNDNGIRDALQILDDTHPDEATHPAEAAVIEKAKNPKMVTITTAAGSRGTNFRAKRMMEIIAKPASQRVTGQEMGRVSRDDDFGIVLEIYCDDDIPEIPESEAKRQFGEQSGEDEKKVTVGDNFRGRCEFWQAGEQARDLQRIKDRAPLRAIIQAMSDKFIQHRDEMGGLDSDKQKFRQRWASWLEATSDYMSWDGSTKAAMLEAWELSFAGDAWQEAGKHCLLQAMQAATEEASDSSRAREHLMALPHKKH